MATSLAWDILGGNQAVDGPDGKTMIQMVRIDGLTQDPSGTLVYRALHDSIVPTIGALHKDTVPSSTIEGWVLERKEFGEFLNSRTSAMIRLHWRYLDYYEKDGYHGTNCGVRLNGTLLREQSRFDNAGKPFIVWYKSGMAARSTQAQVQAAGGLQEFALGQVFVPHDILEFDRYERFTYDSPQAVWFRAYRGKVNLESFQSCAQRAWKCVNVQQERWEPQGAGNLWRRRYAFEFQDVPSGTGRSPFDPVLWYIRNMESRPPADVNPNADGFPNASEGNGWRQWELHDVIDYSLLALPRIA